MVTIDLKKCSKCGVCIKRFDGYCINGINGEPRIDYVVCNQCQKCIAVCPSRAIRMNGTKPLKIEGKSPVGHEELMDFLSRRRSIKKFTRKKIPRKLLEEIAISASYAPNQNKNIDVLIIDDPEIIGRIDQKALKFVGLFYRIMFSIPVITKFMSLFSESLIPLKRKMEYDLFRNKKIVKENTNAVMLMLGNPKVPVTEVSAQYLLAAMILAAEALGVGSTLMDSLKITLNTNKKLRRSLGINPADKVLGVLALGYSNENILNIPQGYEVNIYWNNAAGGNPHR